ncbi:MAG: MotE family protein [Verrucomicrobiia bacterium]
MTTLIAWGPEIDPATETQSKQTETAASPWAFHNPELTHLIEELRRERSALAEKEKALLELSARLEAERQELNQLTQVVDSVRLDLDQTVIRIREQEASNLKKLGKIYAGMAPENAVPILKQMDETALVKILGQMKESESGPILESMGKGGEADSKLAAAVSDRLRLVVPPLAGPSASRR